MTNEVIVFPDATALVISYLRAELSARGDSADVGSRIPHPNTTDLVRVFRTGGTSTLHVTDQAQLTIETYADRAERAHDLAQLVRGLLHALPGTVQFGVAFYGVVEFSGPQEFPDPVSNKPRVTFTVQISVRGAAA